MELTSTMKYILFPLLLIGLTFPFLRGQGTDSPITTNVYFDGEPFLISKPDEPHKLTIAWMGFHLPDGLRITIRSRTSTDGGNTWSPPVSLPHVKTGWGSADPTMAYGPDGSLYLVYIDYIKSPDSGQIVICKSSDSGLNWTGPFLVMDMTEDYPERPIDRPWLVCDRSGGPHSGNLYPTSKPAPWIPAPNRAYHKRSTDGGLTWSPARFVDTTNYLIGNLIQQPMTYPMVYADGKFAMFYPSYVASQNILPLFYQALSGDGGQTFQYTNAILNPQGVQDTNYKVGYSFMAHPTDPQKAVMVGVFAMNGDPDIVVTRTTDQGQSWSPLLRVNQDGLANGKAQDMPWCAWNQQGHLAVVWRDRRNDAGSGFFVSSEIYASVSYNDGLSFGQDFPMSSQPAAFDSILIENGNDFMGAVFSGDTLYAAWGDVRTGNLNIYFSRKVMGTGTSQVQVIDQVAYPTLVLFPNPAKSTCRVIPDPQLFGAEWTIKDAQGRVMMKGIFQENQEELNVSGLSSGFYILSGKSGGLPFRSALIIE